MSCTKSSLRTPSLQDIWPPGQYKPQKVFLAIFDRCSLKSIFHRKTTLSSNLQLTYFLPQIILRSVWICFYVFVEVHNLLFYWGLAYYFWSKKLIQIVVFYFSPTFFYWLHWSWTDTVSLFYFMILFITPKVISYSFAISLCINIFLFLVFLA